MMKGAWIWASGLGKAGNMDCKDSFGQLLRREGNTAKEHRRRGEYVPCNCVSGYRNEGISAVLAIHGKHVQPKKAIAFSVPDSEVDVVWGGSIGSLLKDVE